MTQKTSHVSFDECQAALTDILSSPKDKAVIHQLCIRPDFEQRLFPNEVSLSVASGIAGDKRWLTKPWLKLANGEPDPNIQVCIINQRVMDLCWQDKASTIHPGDLFAVDMDLSEENLPAGTQLKVGTAIIEVSNEFNNGCVKWRQRYGVDSYKWINMREHRHLRLRGILCKIVKDGTIRIGDELEKIAL